jgi:polysaccharide deacetylase family protein (PEP-CTERM system associated)
MLVHRQGVFGTVTLTVVLLVLHPLLLRTHLLTPGLGILSFAVLCLLLSGFISVRLQRSRRKAASALKARDVRVMERTVPSALTPSKPPAIVNAFSIDLEDYFHTEVATRAVSYSEWDVMPSRIRSSVSRLLDVLDEGNTRSTVFVLGWVARKYPSLVRQVAERGHELACHSDRHRPVFRLTKDSFREDTRMAKSAIEDACGAEVSGYRAPSFSITPGTGWAFDVLEELGFRYDSSVNPIKHPFYGNASAPRKPHYVGETSLLEIPIATWRVAGVNLPVGGGAYLRLLPYQYVRTGLACINRWENQPFTVYVHPWEIDGYQPLLKLNWKSNIRQTWGVTTMEGRIANLLSSFQFSPIAEVYGHLLLPQVHELEKYRHLPQFTEQFTRAAS